MARPEVTGRKFSRPAVVTVDEAIFILNSNRDEIYKLLAEKKLLSFLDGRRRKIFTSSIDQLLEERREAALREPFVRSRHPRHWKTLGDAMQRVVERVNPRGK